MSGIIGLDNNNPFNIVQMSKGNEWFGSIGADRVNRHTIFPPGSAGLIYAVRAAVRELYRAQWLPADGKPNHTPRDLVGDYEPTGHAQNRPERDAVFMAGKIGVQPDDSVLFLQRDGSIVDAERLKAWLRARCELENFAGYILPEAELASGIALYKRHLSQGMWKDSMAEAGRLVA